MAKQKIEIEVDVPDGWEAIDYRIPKLGEFVISHNTNDLDRVSETTNILCVKEYLILRRVKQYREPVLPADYLKPCEFSDDGKAWWTGKLYGFWKNNSSDGKIWSDSSAWRVYCRIEKESTE